jgi:hypothetical protein
MKFKNFILFKKLEKLNKYLFDNNNFLKKDNLILIEYNNFYGSHLCQALLANFYKKKFGGTIVAYYNYSLIVSPLKLNFFQKLKWKISIFTSYAFKGIYKSFGVAEFIKPEINLYLRKKSERFCNTRFSQIKNLDDLINLKINNIWIGDLLYDTYLKSKTKPTIELQSTDFKLFFFEFVCLFYFWEEFFNKNNVKTVIGVHSCYSYGINIRIAIYRNIPAFTASTVAICKLNKKNLHMYGEYKFFKRIFSKFSKKFKLKAMQLAKKKLNLRFKGYYGIDVDLYNTNKSSFSKINNQTRYLTRSNKIKILISTHDFTDSVHVNGKLFFPDFYQWLKYLGELSNENKYEWYIKNHPSFGNKYERYQKFTHQTVNALLMEYKNIKLLPNDISHHQLIKEGINYVLTGYGSVAVEYSFFGIPVINASKNNPHSNYSFSITPKNINKYKNIISNLKNLKFKINKKEIYEYYFMRNIYPDQQWLFDNYKLFMSKIGGYHNIHSEHFYSYWLKYFNINLVSKIYSRLDSFVNNSNSYRISINDTNKNIY